MTSDQFNAIRRRSGLSLSQLAVLFGMAGDRPLRRIQDGSQEPSGPIALCMNLLDQGRLEPEVAAMLASEITSGQQS